MLLPDPSLRIKINEIFSHPWIKLYKQDQIKYYKKLTPQSNTTNFQIKRNGENLKKKKINIKKESNYLRCSDNTVKQIKSNKLSLTEKHNHSQERILDNENNVLSNKSQDTSYLSNENFQENEEKREIRFEELPITF